MTRTNNWSCTVFLINQHNSIGSYVHESFELLNDWICILPYNKLELDAGESDKRF